MSEITRILDQLKRSHEGPAWHGPSLGEILEGVAPAQAARRTLESAHNIWELVLHISAWEDFTRHTAMGDPKPVTPDINWPRVVDISEEAWRSAVAGLNQSDSELRAAISSFPESRLDETVPDRDFSYYVLFHGVVQHNLYHAGQIALLKKG